MRQQTVAAAGFGIQLHGIGERKDVNRIQEIRPGIAITGSLRKPDIETAACCGGALDHHSVKNFSMGFVFVETVIKICPEQSRAL